MSETKSTNPHGVKVGDIWEDCDKRIAKRKLTVTLVDLDKARARVEAAPTGRLSYIALNRFKPTSTGYRRIKEGT